MREFGMDGFQKSNFMIISMISEQLRVREGHDGGKACSRVSLCTADRHDCLVFFGPKESV